VYGKAGKEGFVMIFSIRSRRAKPVAIEIRYCPFCGVRLDTLQLETSHRVSVRGLKDST
jgi:hypothetical protein